MILEAMITLNEFFGIICMAIGLFLSYYVIKFTFGFIAMIYMILEERVLFIKEKSPLIFKISKYALIACFVGFSIYGFLVTAE